MDKPMKHDMKWICTKHALPDKDGYYLVTYVFDNHRFYFDRWFSNAEGKFYTTENITHWMPLPEPPYE